MVEFYLNNYTRGADVSPYVSLFPWIRNMVIILNVVNIVYKLKY